MHKTYRDTDVTSEPQHNNTTQCLQVLQVKNILFLSGQLRTLIAEAQSRGLRFVYALSPGQDIVFSSSSDVTLLKRKLRQVQAHLRGRVIRLICRFHSQTQSTALSLQVSDLGCQAFAILFDDIDHSLCQADSEAFSSFAHAQVNVTNEVYRFLGEPPVFLFCPTGEMVGSFVVENLKELSCTFFHRLCMYIYYSSHLFPPLEYCDSLCSPSVSKSPYLQTVGEDLLPNVTVVWTGETCIMLFT